MTPSAVVIRIRERRKEYPRWGRQKLRALLARDGIRVSAKTIDRTIARLKAEASCARVCSRAEAARGRRITRLRRPTGLAVERPASCSSTPRTCASTGRRSSRSPPSTASRASASSPSGSGSRARTVRPSSSAPVRASPSWCGLSRPTAARSSWATSSPPRRAARIPHTAAGLDRQLQAWNAVY